MGIFVSLFYEFMLNLFGETIMFGLDLVVLGSIDVDLKLAKSLSCLTTRVLFYFYGSSSLVVRFDLSNFLIALVRFLAISEA
jgi:hypothetical protein